ncbi:MAG: hypothetical protein LC740_15575 [Actinobacteria bacterium]|nr:hypothetical protein [Actinomycetota bacterium]
MSGQPPGRRAIARPTVETDAETPRASSNASRCSSSVRSGFYWRWDGSHPSSAAPLTEGRPGIALSAPRPRSRDGA